MWKQLSDGAPSQPKFAFHQHNVARANAVLSLVAEFRGKQKVSLLSASTHWTDSLPRYGLRKQMPINRGTNYISVFYLVIFLLLSIFTIAFFISLGDKTTNMYKTSGRGTRGRSNNLPRSQNAVQIDNDFHCYGSFLAQQRRAWPHEASTLEHMWTWRKLIDVDVHA